MNRICFAALAALVLAGCEMGADPTDALQPTSSPSASEVYPMGDIPGDPQGPYVNREHPDYHDTVIAVFDEAMAALDQAGAATAASRHDPLPVRDVKLRRALDADLSPQARWVVVSMEAPRLLSAHLAQPEPDVEAIGFLADQMLAQRNPNADVLAEAFGALDGTWAPARLAAARHDAAEAAVAYLARGCTDCAQPDAMPAKKDEIAHALASLQTDA